MATPEFSVPETISENALQDVILEFSRVGVIKFGNFTLKSGVQSPIYVDLREIISYPALLKTAAKLISHVVFEKEHRKFKVICGVPYAALPIATLIACERNVSMVMRRKEAKDHGTKKVVEGRIEQEASCLIIDDVCTSGISILETAIDLKAAGLVVTDAVVLLDRESGGTEFLAKHGITLHAALTLSTLCSALVKAGSLSTNVAEEVHKFIGASRSKAINGDQQTVPVNFPPSWKKLGFSERKLKTKNLVAQRLFSIMDEKQTCLAVSVDLTTSASVLQLVNGIGPHVCVVKIHADIIEDFSAEFTMQLQSLAKKHNFLIMEDRKFADIGNTVHLQFVGGLLRIADWADIVTVHALPGSGVINGLKQENDRPLGAVLVAEMSCKGTLTNKYYVDGTVKIAENNREDVVGFVCQSDVSNDGGFVRFAPGVHISSAGDPLGQQYNLPEDIVRKFADVVIVGRGITGAADPVAAAVEYKSRAYNAYRHRTE